MKGPFLIELNQIGDDAIGFISVAENQSHIPFDIKRVYWTYKTPCDVIRGGHAHLQLEQVVFCVSGRLVLTVEHRLYGRQEFVLDSPHKGLYLPPMTWRDIQLDEASVLLCLASELYVEADYIRDYKQFEILQEENI